MTHDYKRHGTTTLFAALYLKSFIVIFYCQPLHLSKYFILFFNLIYLYFNNHLYIHLFLYNYFTHNTPYFNSSLTKHPHFTTLHTLHYLYPFFIVNLFKGSDKICFYVLSEFRKAINFNVTMLSVIFSLIVSVVAVLNILWSRSVDFYKLAGVPQGRWLPPPSRSSAWSSRPRPSSIWPFSAPPLVQSASA